MYVLLRTLSHYLTSTYIHIYIHIHPYIHIHIYTYHNTHNKSIKHYYYIMSHRRGAPSLDSYATERREWYHTMQLKLYQSPPEPDTSDDESTSYCIDTARRSSSKHRKSSDIDRRLSHMISMNSTVDTLSDGRSDTRSDIRSDTRPNTRSDMKADTRADSKQNSRPNTQSSYTSFLATLAHETEKMASKPQSPARDTDSFLSGERKIREFDSSLLDKSLLRLNSPKCPQ